MKYTLLIFAGRSVDGVASAKLVFHSRKQAEEARRLINEELYWAMTFIFAGEV